MVLILLMLTYLDWSFFITLTKPSKHEVWGLSIIFKFNVFKLCFVNWMGMSFLIILLCSSYFQVLCPSPQTLFIEKNNDALHASLEFLIQDSSNKMLKAMFEGIQVSSGKLNFISVGSKFRSQLQTLMEKLKSTVSPVVSHCLLKTNFSEILLLGQCKESNIHHQSLDNWQQIQWIVLEIV